MCAPSSHSHHRPDKCPKPAPAQCTLVMSVIVPCTAQKLPRTRSHRCGMMHPDRHARASPIRAQMVRHAANLDKVFAVADKAGSKLTQQWRRRLAYHPGEPRLPSPEREGGRGSPDRRRPGRVGGTFSSASLDEDGHRGLV